MKDNEEKQEPPKYPDRAYQMLILEEAGTGKRIAVPIPYNMAQKQLLMIGIIKPWQYLDADCKWDEINET